jgi:hypothetical protein
MITGEDLINTTSPPTGGYLHAKEAWQSFDYQNGLPYPAHAFAPPQWPADKGPFPTPLPYVKSLISEGADFIFQGGNPSFSVPDSPEADAFLADVIKVNRLSSRYNPLARQNGNAGTMAAKFSFDTDTGFGAPVRVTFLSVPEECRVWTDPHDQQRILLARVQYPYRDPQNGKWYYFREEWTERTWIKYHAKEAGASQITGPMNLPGYSLSMGDGDGWEIESQEENPFGLIPITLIKNIAQEGSPLGIGDCWGSFRLIDRIALTMHGEDRSNQMHSDPTTVAMNAELEGGAVVPGEVLAVRNTNPDGPGADVKLLEPTGAAREFSHKSIDKWEELLYKAIGLSRLDPATLTNKGNMTRLALMTAYARTVATSDLKRTNWGEAGLSLFFRALLIGLSRTGAFPEIRRLGEMIDVSCAWADYFAPTEADLSDVTNRTVTQVGANLLPQNRAVTRLATLEGIPAAEHPALLQELDDELAARKLSEQLNEAKTPLTTEAGSSTASSSDALSELSDTSGSNNFSD